jgi:REP element-mobilizing transposase RayT
MLWGKLLASQENMGEPPRLSEIQLPWEQSIVYFVTLCVKERQKVLANKRVFDAATSVIQQLRRCQVLAAVFMPDRAHFIISPTEDRELSIGDFAAGFKRLLRKAIPSQSWKWQRGCFDRLLRSDENLEDKWIYVQDHPVRAGLVRKAEDWPSYLDFINDSGKLAASPKKAEEA